MWLKLSWTTMLISSLVMSEIQFLLCQNVVFQMPSTIKFKFHFLDLISFCNRALPKKWELYRLSCHLFFSLALSLLNLKSLNLFCQRESGLRTVPLRVPLRVSSEPQTSSSSGPGPAESVIIAPLQVWVQVWVKVQLSSSLLLWVKEVIEQSTLKNASHSQFCALTYPS